MNAFTHVYLSMVFKRVVEKKLSVKLDTFSLIRGSLKPDFSLLLIKTPHYRIPDSEIVKREIDKLIKETTDNYTTSVINFSERLGIITHYLSDFFCYAHSPAFKGGILRHFIYEKKLAGYCRSMKGKLLDFTGSVLYSSCSQDYQSICRLLDQLHTKYRSKKPSYARDLAFTLRAGVLLAASLVSACLQVEPDELAA